MKKLYLFSILILPCILGGCSLDFSAKTEINMDVLVNSWSELLSGAKNTANEYYQDQIKPTVDNVVDTTKEKADEMLQKAKSGYNAQVDKASDYVKDQIGSEIWKLKVE